MLDGPSSEQLDQVYYGLYVLLQRIPILPCNVMFYSAVRIMPFTMSFIFMIIINKYYLDTIIIIIVSKFESKK